MCTFVRVNSLLPASRRELTYTETLHVRSRSGAHWNQVFTWVRLKKRILLHSKMENYFLGNALAMVSLKSALGVPPVTGNYTHVGT